ncbi:thiopurine S-methyltransferase [Marinomonas aquiplantarum]|uniref:Thiopurine S-methyltransferase n=1 Tax=Marinomonas aquiplantarum TaxID=491951 RepID=A0A366D3U1_9GAMM|nr:thiopurine S-methyltransferase [Marinomonas aquiplantarum]RBO84114.1 thiopurine S-methyltransferase [Marinomonas aquiplantarum]
MITNDFWLERWQTGRIGFHQEGINPKLVDYWPILAKQSKVLVPLCGKTNDMIWLAEQGYQVTGVELSSLAIIEFIGDNDLTYETLQQGNLKIHTVNELPIRLIEGDYFDFNEQGFDACYDRAAMVAMPQNVREKYVQHTLQRLSQKAFVLLITLQYQGDKKGPPFSVAEKEVIQLWGTDIKKLASENLMETNPDYRDGSYTSFEESVWHIDQN